MTIESLTINLQQMGKFFLELLRDHFPDDKQVFSSLPINISAAPQ